jgi:hypothetical protein
MELVTGAGILTGVIIVAGILVGVSVILVVTLVVVPRLATKAMEPSLERRVSTTYSSEQILLKDLKALTFGLESRGVLQGRGNGALVLTANELAWFRFVPESSDFRIPRETITKVDTVTTHLGKSYGRNLLRVTFTNNGEPDSMAWYVMDLDAWTSKLDEPTKATP